MSSIADTEDDLSKKSRTTNSPSQKIGPWPEEQDMRSQQEAANRMFRVNSEQIQQKEAAKREVQTRVETTKNNKTQTFVKNREQGGREKLKQEHAALTKADATSPKRSPNKKLHFVKNAERSDRARLKSEHAKQTGRGAEEPKPQERGKTLHFVKNRGNDLSRG